MVRTPGRSLVSSLRVGPAWISSNITLHDDLKGIVSEFHDRAVPKCAIDALEKLYGSVYASFAHLNLTDALPQLPTTWIGYEGGEIIAVLLFLVRFDQVVVLTELMCLEPRIVDAFRHAVLARFGSVNSIHFNAISLTQPLTAGPQQSYAFSENYIITLPRSVDLYRAALGKSTRKTIKGYSNRLQRDFSAFVWETHQASQMPAHALRALIRQLQNFKRDGLAARGKRAELSRRDVARMLVLIRAGGLIGVARVGERICGGSLACRVGDNYVMLFSAADPSMAAYRLGMLCCFWAVCDCIHAGARECHLLWGRYQYKTQLLAQPHTLLRLTIYRSWLQMCLSPLMVLGMSATGARFRLRRWLLLKQHHEPWLSWLKKISQRAASWLR